MSLAKLIITEVLVEGRPKAAVARDYGIARSWVHELVNRYQAEGEAGLEPRSRRPHTVPHQTPQAIEDEIVALRKQLDDDGLDAGAATIATLLERRRGSSPAVSTIWRILVRRGFVTPQPHKRPKSSYVRFEADQPNERWQADTTHWQLADGTDVEICNIIDDHSRLLIASAARRTFKAGDVVDVFMAGFEARGLPATVLTDNAAIFYGAPRRKGQVAIERQLDLLDIRMIHSRPYHPQTCGKVERFHQTLKKRLRSLEPAKTIDQLQTQLDEFAHVYNHDRPHRAIGRATPYEAWTARPRATPAGGLDQPHCRIRRDVINNGTVTLRHNSRLHHIGIGKPHTGTRVLVLVADLHIRVITQDGRLLRELTLDPSRDYQPRGPKRPAEKPQQ
jgi:transposase InsO family protein